MQIDFYEAENACTKIVVVGVGGGGCNSVNRMIEAGVKGVEFIAVNTDLQALRNSRAMKKIPIGTKLTGGRGAGALPEIGEKAALEDESTLRDNLKGANLVFITAGMGGGTGTGAAPVIAKIAKELNCLTVAVVTKPFDFENRVKGKIAAEGITKLEKTVDTLILISNQALADHCNNNVSMVDAWRMADDVLKQGVQGISNLIIKPGEMNIDFADVQTVMRNRGKALMGVGYGRGDNAAVDAATMAIENPLMPDLVVDKAKAILVNVTGSSKMTFQTYNSVMNFVQNIASEDALLIPGQAFDDSFEDRIEVTIIATGFEEAERVKPDEIEKERKENKAGKEAGEARVSMLETGERARKNSEKDVDVYSRDEFKSLLSTKTGLEQQNSEIPAFMRMFNGTKTIGRPQKGKTQLD